GSDLVVLIRFPKSTRDPKSLKEQLLASPSLENIPGWKGKAPRVTVDNLGVAWQHSCSLKHPKPEEVQGWVEQILRRLAEVTPAFAGQCEECQTSGVQRHVLLNGIPIYLCTNCQSRLVSEGDMHQRKYDQLEANYFMGAAFGAVGAV